MDLGTVDHLLTTTRSVRKRLDFKRPVEPELLEECLEIALQAPTGSNVQGWHFLFVTDAQKRAAIAALYKQGFEMYAAMQAQIQPPYGDNDPRATQMPRIIDSASYLVEHLHEVPVMVIPCIEGRIENSGVLAQASVYGSILPAVWSLMLALRSRGLGSAWTTLHLMFEKDAAQILEVPDHVTQTALLPIAYFTGKDFKPAKRLPARQLTHWNTWGQRRAGVLCDV